MRRKVSIGISRWSIMGAKPSSLGWVNSDGWLTVSPAECIHDELKIEAAAAFLSTHGGPEK